MYKILGEDKVMVDTLRTEVRAAAAPRRAPSCLAARTLTRLARALACCRRARCLAPRGSQSSPPRPPTRPPPQALPAEYSLAPDAPQIAFRKLRQQWVDIGYAVPPEAPGAPRRGLLDGQ